MAFGKKGKTPKQALENAEKLKSLLKLLAISQLKKDQQEKTGNQ